MATIRIKRGTESQIIDGTLEVGELALATDTCSLYSYNGLTKCIVGKAIVDTYASITTYSGLSGRFFFALDQNKLYIYNGTEWHYTDDALLSQLTTTSGDIVSQIPSLAGYATQSWTNGQFYTQLQITTISGNIVTQIPSLAGYATETWVGNQSYATTAKLTTASGDIVSQIPSLTGYATQSWANGEFVTPATLSTTSGNIVSQIPSLTGYATQSWANGEFITPATLITVSGNIVTQIPSLAGYATQNWANGQFYTQAQSTTQSGNIVAQIPSTASFATTAQLTTTSGDIVAQIGGAPGGSGIRGNDWFINAGRTITHSLGTVDHFTSVTPTCSGNDNAAMIGAIYVNLGVNTDTVFSTGGTNADGLPFAWFATK